MDDLDLYLREIARQPLLTREQERELGRKMRSRDKEKAKAAHEHFIKANTRLVVNIAKKYRGHGVDFRDLISAGNIGLLLAAKRWDWRKNVRFSTYAYYWIKQKVQRCVEATITTIRVPGKTQEALRKYQRIEEAAATGDGKQPQPSEIVEQLGLNDRQALRLEKAMLARGSVPLVQQDVDDGSLLRNEVREMVDCLPIEFAASVRLAFGFGQPGDDEVVAELPLDRKYYIEGGLRRLRGEWDW